MNRIEQLIVNPLSWSVGIFILAVATDLASLHVLSFFYSAVAAWMIGAWFAGAPFDHLFRWFMWIRHRRGCGFQHFKILRRETIDLHRIDTVLLEIEIPIMDLRCQCPKCGRIHQHHAPGTPRVKRRNE